jgi:hypothetical protein
MADNILAQAFLSTAQGSAIRIKATDVSSVYEITTDSTGDVALIIPGVMQASNQNLAAPLRAKDNLDGTYSLVTTPA